MSNKKKLLTISSLSEAKKDFVNQTLKKIEDDLDEAMPEAVLTVFEGMYKRHKEEFHKRGDSICQMENSIMISLVYVCIKYLKKDIERNQSFKLIDTTKAAKEIKPGAVKIDAVKYDKKTKELKIKTTFKGGNDDGGNN